MAEITQDLLDQFRAPMFPGSFFLSFEGIEGAGKSTQILKTKEFLEKNNFRVIVLREPGGTPFGEKLRQAILEMKTEITPLAEAHLFLSSRAQLLSEVTLKELAVPNTIVIYDRYLDSTISYQGHSRGLGVAEILKIHQIFPLNLVPHLTFYLKISPETSNKRQKIRNAPKDYFESKGTAFYEKLVLGFDLASELFKNRIVAIDAERDLDSITRDIEKHLTKLLEGHNHYGTKKDITNF
jgi:dTMP kinase